MYQFLNCEGLACPEPVLQTKAALESLDGDGLTVLVDNSASRENVTRFAESRGCSVSFEARNDSSWALHISPRATAEVLDPKPEAGLAPAEAPVVFLVSNDRIGPEPELGAVLMKAFLGTLREVGTRPSKLLFLNRGVNLTTTGSETLDILAELEADGVEIRSCGTCLEYLGVRDALQVGTVTNMYDTVEALTGSFRVVTVA